MDHLGSYEIIRRLARGGMAELFLARGQGNTGGERVVVLKKILPKYAANPRMVQLFLDEAKLAGSLDHPHIVRSFETGKDAGNLFFAMEYLHGQDVRSILHRSWQLREQMPVRHAVRVATQVAAALHYAHEKRRPDGSLMNVVHRDVSPSNIVVAYDGTVKLLDFGVAKATTSTVKTRTGTLKGKISYMSPEQARGASIDRRSDIFSLGIVLWEMVTTQRLFKAENDLATLQMIINEPPRRPSLLQPECTPELERIILRALAQDLSARYATADELVRDLHDASDQLGPPDEQLSEFVARLFSPELRAWEEAQAAGVALSAHLVSGGDRTVPVTESDFVESFDLNDLDDLDELDDPLESADDMDPVPPTDVTLEALPPARPSTGPSPVVPPRSRPSTGPSPAVPPRPPPPRGVRPTPEVGLKATIAAGPPAGTALHELPTVTATEFPEPATEAPALPANPWPIASGSNVSASGSYSASAPAPVPAAAPVRATFQLDPAVADRALRRGVQVAAVILVLIVAIAIVKGCSGSADAGERPAPAERSTP